MIIGVSGRNGAGKGEFIKCLEREGFRSLSLSDAIRRVLEERGLGETRERMIDTGRELRAEGGPGVLAERLLEMMDSGGDYAVDSVRHPAEVAVLRASGRPFRLVWVDADESVRFARIQVRGRPGDPHSVDELRALEARELASKDPAAQQLLAVQAGADLTLRNDRGLEQLCEAARGLLA
jgi:dephospho-CoA kinase